MTISSRSRQTDMSLSATGTDCGDTFPFVDPPCRRDSSTSSPDRPAFVERFCLSALADEAELVLAAFVEGIRHVAVAPKTGTLRGECSASER
jgi:hypothetical protein